MRQFAGQRAGGRLSTVLSSVVFPSSQVSPASVRPFPHTLAGCVVVVVEVVEVVVLSVVVVVDGTVVVVVVGAVVVVVEVVTVVEVEGLVDDVVGAVVVDE